MHQYPLLSFLIIFPLAGSLLLPVLWRCREPVVRWLALAVALLELGLCGWLLTVGPGWGTAPGAPSGYFLWEDAVWIARFGIGYLLGMDGISLLLALLTAFITVVAMLVSWRGVTERVPLHYALLLALESGILGVFLAQDLVLFYLFWELMLLPMFFLILIWGHGRRVYSAVKFFLYTLAGSLLMLLAIMGIHLLHGAQTGHYSFALPLLVKSPIAHPAAPWLFAAFLLAFAIKFPVFPLHTWLPDAHTDAPTAGSVILAGLLLKTGAYGLLRIGVPLFPSVAADCRPLLYALAIIGIIYAAWIAYAQEDMKRLVAYSSVSHMGFVLLGIAAWSPVALSGAVLQMVNHGITTAALFALVGMLDERTGTREVAAYGGLWGKVPLLSGLFLLFAMASAGLPGFNNFVGEFLVLVGVFRTTPLAGVLAFLGIILPLVYTVRLVQQVLFQTERRPLPMPDLTGREGGILAVMAILDIYIGLHPKPLLDLINLPVGLLTGQPGGLP
jgi:NADH-quinone oxidoreductase subunit M